ncbi:MAG: hypothetical protein ACTSXL_01625 [Alphaproteobacteria bacterium]|nr:MAG: hypothetical protein B6I23_01750 [Rickettsiaceae bacterium 4572_127]
MYIKRSIRKSFALFLSCFIPNRHWRKKLKRAIINDEKDRKLDKKMKLGALYSVWDGEELLEASIKSIRKNVDYITVVWQEKSWVGTQCSKELIPLLKRLKKEKMIDSYIEYKVKNTTPARNEKLKRQVALDELKKAKCSHFLILDVDEFYIPKQLKKAKALIVEKNIKYSACTFYNYCLKPTYRDLNIAGFSVQFITKLEKNTKIGTKDRCCVIDPTRITSFKNKKVYYFDNLQMHHMAFVRKDLKRKLLNSSGVRSGKQERIKLFEKLSKLNDRNILKNGYIKVSNIFGIKF